MSDPAEKYRDRLSADHALAMQAIGMARLLLQGHRTTYDVFLKARRDMDSIGIVVDPTLYSDMLHSKSLAQQVRMVEAATAFLRAIDGVAGEVEAAKGPSA